jgi:hypothetical protein
MQVLPLPCVRALRRNPSSGFLIKPLAAKVVSFQSLLHGSGRKRRVVEGEGLIYIQILIGSILLDIGRHP